MTLCGEKRELWITDRTHGTLKTAYTKLSSKPYEPIFMELKGVLGNVPTDGFGADYDGGIIAMEIIHASRINESFGCREKYANFIFKASGNEPGWSVIVSTNEIKYASINSPSQSFPIALQQQDGETIIYETSNSNMSLTLSLYPKMCTDSMSGEQFGWKATATIGETDFQGCAVKGDQ